MLRSSVPALRLTGPGRVTGVLGGGSRGPCDGNAHKVQRPHDEYTCDRQVEIFQSKESLLYRL